MNPVNPQGIDRLATYSVTASNLKCFRDHQGIDGFKPINIIIGKNNAGKSTLLDLIQHMVDRKKWQSDNGSAAQLPEIILRRTIDSDLIAKTCQGSSFRGSRLSFLDFASDRLNGQILPYKPYENNKLIDDFKILRHDAHPNPVQLRV